uniref:Mediator complex subunit Med12 LCEWAV-domain domain-containing protein n=1 Tax=Meloidogyne enterolobii TaxID=390850 RepID=A0A6V7WKB7_MELEN|nr:unnamed protein product [Meloidogyne enterolobii]
MKTSRIFATDDQLYRAARWIKQVMNKKNELNVIWLDKNWIKENNVRGFISDCFREEFFESLVSGKRIQLKDIKRHSLAACFPRFLRTSYDQLNSLASAKTVPLCEAMSLLYEKGVPIQKAIWFLKMNQVAHPILVTASKQKKGGNTLPSDDYSSDQRQFFIRYLRCLLREFDKAIPGQLEQNPYYQRWPYYAALIKHSFEDGMLDRHEFVLDMCELLAEFSNFSLDQPQTFRILIILMTQFTDIVVQNVFIARRVASILCSRLMQYRKDYEKMRSQNLSPIAPETCFDDLSNCQHHRPTLLVIFGFLHAIILDCPSALIWTPFEPQELLEGSLKSSKLSRAVEKENALQSVVWLCGSPLDYLPCKIEVTCQHFSGSFKDKILDLLNKKVDEIKMRSSAVEDRWAFISPSNSQFGIDVIIEECLNIISFLDTIPLDKPNALHILYENIFPKDEDLNESVGINIRVRILVLWAVTAERSGTYRSLLVTKLLLLSKSENKFCSLKSIHSLLVDCLNRDWAFNERNKNKTDEGNDGRWNVEFGNLMLLFYELQRVGIFDHDRYVRALMRNGTLGQSPLYQRLKASETSESQPERVEQQNSSKRQSVDLVPVKQEPQMIISFIPTTPSVSSTVNTNPFSGSTPQQNQQKSDEFAKLQQEYEPDVHPHLDIKSKLSFHERFLLHLPVEQLESNRDACNQRAIVLYGISDQRDQVRQDLRKIAREICKLWKRLSVEFVQTSPDSPTRELRYKRKCTNEQIAEQMDKFKSQTYFDQLIICGWCTENFVDSIEEFLRQLTEQQTVLSPFPTSECLDLLCEMIMICKNPHSLLSLSAELLPFLIQIEQEFQRSNQKIIFDTIPNSLTCQLAYVIVARLAEHLYYFLYSPEACSIYNSLFKLIQNDLELSRQNFPITCWSRTIAIFLLHTRNKLIGVGEEEGKITKINLLGKYEDLAALFPSAGSGSLARNLKYDQQLMVDQLNLSSSNNFRFLSYVDLKMRLQTMQNEHSKYSFVVNAFRAANSYGRDYERLVELANFCAHVSTQLGLETEWCSAIQELCCSNVSNNSNWNEMLFEINVNDFSTHYSLATFVLLLASKYAFSPHALICRLIANVFYSIIREEGGFANDDLDNGFCLALCICSVLFCGNDMPFICNDLGQRVITSSTLRRDCNQVALKIAHITELNFVLFPLLSVVMQLVDELKRKVEASRKDATNHRKFSKQLAIARCALLSICDQDWVIERMHAICSSDKDMDNFINCPRLKNHSVGQQLLRVALRRKSERDIKQELMECTDKTIYEKLLSALSIWNMRATYFDFKLIINETFPESQMSKLGNGNQQLANHYQMTMFLFNNIATAIHQLFVSRLILKDNKQNEEKMDIDDFRPSGINCFWQIASLVTAMPSPPPPTGMSSQNPHWCPWIGSAMKAYILKVVAENLKTLPEKDSKNKQSENIEQLKYEQLLAYQPFLNLVMACTEGEDVKQLVDTLLDYLDDVVARVRKNPIIPHQSFFLSERDGIILRLNLIVGLFDTLTTNSNAEFWASAIFQLLYFEILTYERDTLYFNTCMDMLLMLVHKMYPHKTYSTFVSKFKNFRIPDELYSLQQLLPVPKSQAELTAWDSFSNSIPHNKLIAQGTATTTKGSTNTSQPSQQQTQPNLPVAKPQFQGIVIDKQQVPIHKKILRMLKHEHWMQRQIGPNGEQIISFIPRPGIVGEERMGADPFLAPQKWNKFIFVNLQMSDKKNNSNNNNNLINKI